MNTAFVTGATGFVGSTLVDELLKKGMKVKCAIRKTSNLQWLKGKDIELHEVNLMDQTSIKSAIKGCDYIFHLAGVLFSNTEREFVEGNVKSTENLIWAILSQEQTIKRFVFVSSIIAAGSSKSGEPMVESDDCAPFTWYGKSKWESEKIVLKYRDKLPVTIIRPGAVYGPRDYAMFTSFQVSKTGINIIPGERGKLGSVIHVYDLSRGILDSAMTDITIGEVYFLANDDFIYQEDFGKTIIKAMGKKPYNLLIPYGIWSIAANISELYGKISGKKVLLNRQKVLEFKERFIICSTDKAKKDFGFMQEIPFPEGISSTLEWYRNNNWL